MLVEDRVSDGRGYLEKRWRGLRSSFGVYTIWIAMVWTVFAMLQSLRDFVALAFPVVFELKIAHNRGCLGTRAVKLGMWVWVG